MTEDLKKYQLVSYTQLGTSGKQKNVSIRALPELAKPPPPPNSGNFTDSFRRRDHWRDFFLK